LMTYWWSKKAHHFVITASSLGRWRKILMRKEKLIWGADHQNLIKWLMRCEDEELFDEVPDKWWGTHQNLIFWIVRNYCLLSAIKMRICMAWSSNWHLYGWDSPPAAIFALQEMMNVPLSWEPTKIIRSGSYWILMA
jgi:hypothetical protein